MNLSLLEFVVAILATAQVVEIWHHGSIFADQRDAVQNGTGFSSRLLLCPFCLSNWVAFAVVQLVWVVPLPSRVEDWVDVVWLAGAVTVKAFVMALAAARGANLLNDLTHAWCRTPRPGDAIDVSDPEEEPNRPYWITVGDGIGFKETKSYALRDDWLESLESELAEIGASPDEKKAALRHAAAMTIAAAKNASLPPAIRPGGEQAEVEGDVGRLWFGVHSEKP